VKALDVPLIPGAGQAFTLQLRTQALAFAMLGRTSLMDAQRRIPFEQVERDSLSWIHGEHYSATSTIAAFTTVRCGAPGRSRLLQSCHRVLSNGRPFERFGARALSARNGRLSSSARLSKITWAIELR
jgi:hypothetical protein